MTVNEMSLLISYRLWLFSYSLFFMVMVCCKCLRFRKKRALSDNRLGRDMQGVQQEPENFRGETCLKRDFRDFYAIPSGLSVFLILA